MSWEKLPPAKKIYIGCLNCSSACEQAPMNMLIAVGFGDSYVSMDGERIYTEPCNPQSEDEYKTVQFFEDLARLDPDHDWRIHKYGPLHGEVFQRQGDNLWVCIESNQGFA